MKEQYVGAWLGLLSTTPRSPQLLGRDHPLLTSLEEVRATPQLATDHYMLQTLSKYVDEVTKFSHHTSNIIQLTRGIMYCSHGIVLLSLYSDPEYVLYSVPSTTMHVHRYTIVYHHHYIIHCIIHYHHTLPSYTTHTLPSYTTTYTLPSYTTIIHYYHHHTLPSSPSYTTHTIILIHYHHTLPQSSQQYLI